MKQPTKSGTLLEADFQRVEADNRRGGQSKPLEDVIAHARDEIAAVFSKHREKPITVSR